LLLPFYPQNFANVNAATIRKNQLPDSAAGWQRVSQIYFAILFIEKSQN